MGMSTKSSRIKTILEMKIMWTNCHLGNEKESESLKGDKYKITQMQYLFFRNNIPYKYKRLFLIFWT